MDRPRQLTLTGSVSPTTAWKHVVDAMHESEHRVDDEAIISSIGLVMSQQTGNVATDPRLSDAMKDKKTLAHHAALTGRPAVMRYLIAHGADMERRDRWNMTPIRVCAGMRSRPQAPRTTGHDDCVMALIEAKVNLLVVASGSSVLSVACRFAPQRIVDALLDAGAPVERLVQCGEFHGPMRDAVRYGTNGVIRSLLKRGACASIADLEFAARERPALLPELIRADQVPAILADQMPHVLAEHVWEERRTGAKRLIAACQRVLEGNSH